MRSHVRRRRIAEGLQAAGIKLEAVGPLLVRALWADDGSPAGGGAPLERGAAEDWILLRAWELRREGHRRRGGFDAMLAHPATWAAGRAYPPGSRGSVEVEQGPDGGLETVGEWNVTSAWAHPWSYEATHLYRHRNRNLERRPEGVIRGDCRAVAAVAWGRALRGQFNASWGGWVRLTPTAAQVRADRASADRLLGRDAPMVQYYRKTGPAWPTVPPPAEAAGAAEAADTAGAAEAADTREEEAARKAAILAGAPAWQ